ncbi:hypothetical protein N9M22_05565 [Litoricolaceae bacterium]|nr:hypothetical protein [Litorivicinaceae bacterium]
MINKLTLVFLFFLSLFLIFGVNRQFGLNYSTYLPRPNFESRDGSFNYLSYRGWYYAIPLGKTVDWDLVEKGMYEDVKKAANLNTLKTQK